MDWVGIGIGEPKLPSPSRPRPAFCKSFAPGPRRAGRTAAGSPAVAHKEGIDAAAGEPGKPKGSEPGKERPLLVRARLCPGGERRIDVAQAYGYKDGSAATHILKKSESQRQSNPASRPASHARNGNSRRAYHVSSLAPFRQNGSFRQQPVKQ